MIVGAGTLMPCPASRIAIDADFNAGSSGGSWQRRERWPRGFDLYGLMDGASKFVRAATPSPAFTFTNLIACVRLRSRI